MNEGDPDEQPALKLSSVHDWVSKYVRDHGLDGENLLNTTKDYCERMSEEADNNGLYVITRSQNSPPLARCARIDMDHETVKRALHDAKKMNPALFSPPDDECWLLPN